MASISNALTPLQHSGTPPLPLLHSSLALRTKALHKFIIGANNKQHTSKHNNENYAKANPSLVLL